jgi:hypothetical protein
MLYTMCNSTPPHRSMGHVWLKSLLQSSLYIRYMFFPQLSTSFLRMEAAGTSAMTVSIQPDSVTPQKTTTSIFLPHEMDSFEMQNSSTSYHCNGFPLCVITCHYLNIGTGDAWARHNRDMADLWGVTSLLEPILLSFSVGATLVWGSVCSYNKTRVCQWLRQGTFHKDQFFYIFSYDNLQPST